ncbi:PREDICTED: membrane protein of ER body 1 [Tarenaya hassleriana]|uniref:membrane protein of ER body 1 n=1 Tax=Tarenaya hassleriana TaxID=28532 RepID=UPI00053C2B9A|nr:PREDICTED: membrane protein of ER body 1 [Tarenaya hassleriana]
MESIAVLRDPIVTILGEEAGGMGTSCTDTVLSDEQESDRGFHGAERSFGVDFDKERESGVQESQTDENMDGLSDKDKNPTPETEDLSDKDSPTESDADTTRTRPKTEAVEGYDAETVIKNQQMYYLYCPCCGKDITNTVRVVRKSEFQKGEEKVVPEPVPTSVLDVSNRRPKTTVRDFISWFLHIAVLLFLYIVALSFLYIFALWFIFVSPEELPSASSPHFISIFTLLFIAILALCYQFNPGNNEKKDAEKVTTMPSGPSRFDDSKQGNNEPSHPSGDNESSMLQNDEGVLPSEQPSDINSVNEEGKDTAEPSTPKISKPDVETEQGPDGANETESDGLPVRPEIPGNVPGKGRKLEILNSVVYGGLLESITSLGIVSSAAGSGASTLNIFVMGLANLSSGVTLIVHNLLELRNEKPRRTETGEKEEDRYEQTLGRRDKFYLHMFIVIVSFIVFGIIPPLVYGFSFRGTDKRHYKATAVLAASLVCIISLAIAKAYVSRTREYFKTVFGYTRLAMGASGVSYIVGDFLNNLLEKYGLYDDVGEARRR